MKYITQIHPHALQPSTFGNYQGIQWLNNIPLGVSDNNASSSLNFSFLTPSDMIGNTLIYTIFWTYETSQTLQYKIMSNVHTQILSSFSSISNAWDIKKTVLSITDIGILPDVYVFNRLSSNQIMSYVLGILVEALE